MKRLSVFSFPETREEALAWEADGAKEDQIQHQALHRNILAVAVPRIEGAWAAYIVPVPGQSHTAEALELWREKGEKLPENVARAIFGYLEDVPYAP